MDSILGSYAPFLPCWYVILVLSLTSGSTCTTDSSSSAREAIATGLRNSIFSGLRLERKAEVCQWFLRFGQGSMGIVSVLACILYPIC